MSSHDMPSTEQAPKGGSGSGMEGAIAQLARPGWPAAVAAIVGVGAQIVAFLLGFQAAADQPASPTWARVAAIVGLLVSFGLLTQMAYLVDEGWLPSQPALGFLGFGAFIGGILAFFGVGGAGELFLYTSTVLVYGTLFAGLLWLGAGIGYTSGRSWWRWLLAAPVQLHIGVHAVLFIGLLVEAGSLADAAALVLASL